MSVTFDETPGDIISNLPTDKTPPTHGEIQLVDTLFRQKQNTIQHIFSGTKDVLIVGLLYVILSLPQLDPLIHKFIPVSSTSPYMLLLIKTLIFMITFFVLKNVYLVRKN